VRTQTTVEKEPDTGSFVGFLELMLWIEINKAYINIL